MKIKNIKIDTLTVMLFISGCLGLFSVMALDKLYWKTSILREGYPNFSDDYLLRSIAIFLCTFAVLWSLVSSHKPHFVLDANDKMSLERFGVLGIHLLAVVILFVFILDPSFFNDISKEDGTVEWESALLLFGSSFIMAIEAFKNRHIHLPKFANLSLIGLSLVFFVMAMEEISWFQRVLDIKTPQTFAANYQNEMNLHNFSTGIVENAYYFGAFVFLVVFPFIRASFPIITNQRYFRIFIARPFIAIIGSVACAYNFDMWDIVLTQIEFFGSLIILSLLAVFSDHRNERSIILFTLFLLMATQIEFILDNINFGVLWVVTEYKELLIPLAFFIYCLDVSGQIHELRLAEQETAD